jgi:hypothetical protein
MVTQSFVTCGAQKPLSKITFLPLGPIVTETVSATTFIQESIFSLALSQKIICFAIFYLS